jgi:hypothetical protein
MIFKISQKIAPIIFVVIISFLCALEIVSKHILGSYSIFASRIWIIISILFFFGCLIAYFHRLLNDLGRKRFLPHVVILFVFFISLFRINSYQYTNGESSLELAAAGMNFSKSDWNYHGYSFIGYPSRQYLLNYLPSLFLGRTALAMKLGFIWPFLIGVLVFYVGLSNYLSAKTHLTTELSALAITSLVSFPYLLEWLSRYEQTITPISLTLITLGIFLSWVKSPGQINSFAIFWSGGLLANSYTPGLSSWLLLTLLIFLLTIKHLTHRDYKRAVVGISIFFGLLVFCATSFSTSRGLASTGDAMPRLISAFSIFLFSSPKPFFSPPVLVGFYIYLIYYSIIKPNHINGILIVWIFGTVAASVLSKGYIVYPPDFTLHRALVAVPVLITAVTIFLSTTLIPPKFILNSLSAILLIFSSFSYYETTLKRPPVLSYSVMEDLITLAAKSNLQDKNKFSVNFIIDPFYVNWGSINDYMLYYLPNAKIHTYSADCSSSFEPNFHVIVYSNEEECIQRLRTMFAYSRQLILEGKHITRFANFSSE